MTAVIDASVLVAALGNLDQYGEWSESVISDNHLICPELAMAEASNILRRLVLSGEVSLTKATRTHAELLRLDIELYPFAPFAERIWELRNNLISYDAWYVAIAEAFDLPLVTLKQGSRTKVRFHSSAQPLTAFYPPLAQYARALCAAGISPTEV